jgi:O-antigen ligase
MTNRLAALASKPSSLVYATGLWLALIQISIAASQIVLTVVLALWVYQIVTGTQKPARLPLDVPLGLFVALSLLSASLSFDPATSLTDTKKLLLFSVPYLVVSVFRRPSTVEKMILLLIVVADLAALFSLWQYFFGDLGDLNHRIRGFMSHYMTFSGLLMGVGVLTLAELLFGEKRRVFLMASLGLILMVLLLSLTRSAWVGFSAAAGLLLFLRDRRLLIALPALILAVAVLVPTLVPTDVQMRFRSFVRPDRSGQDRYYMLHSGLRMSANHPWFGVGPDMVSLVYPIYKVEGAPHQENVHLHNNLAQIAAERGFLCLVAWLWLMACLFLASVRAYQHSDVHCGRRALAAGALGVLVSGLVAGLFEYNFGDSEYLMFFLFVMAIPFVLERNRLASVTP